MRARVLSAWRSSVWLSLVTALFWLGSPASAVTIGWLPVGNPGNANDTTGYGAVSYSYFISKYEVTNTQYAEFLSAKAAADPLGLYNTSMGSDATFGGITRSGVSGSFTYTVKSGFASKPVTYVSLFDAMRFSNWLNNGQGITTTETGAYTIIGGTATPSNYTTIARNALSTTFLTSQNEWYKAAYFNGTGYFAYPAQSSTPTTCASPTATANRANCFRFVTLSLTDVASYTGSASPYGTFGQGGNVTEWTDTFLFAYYRAALGGNASQGAGFLAASAAVPNYDPATESAFNGFRVASLVPEPGTGLLVMAVLVMAGLMGLAAARRRRA